MDLNAPLGMTPPPKSRRRIVLAVGGIVATVAIGGVAFVLATADPHGGEPYAVAVVPQRQARPPADKGAIDPIETGSLTRAGHDLASAGRPDDSAADVEHGVKVFRSIRPATTGAGSGPLVIDVSKALDDPLGRGKRTSVPSATDRAASGATMPRIAIFVSGMGLSATTTRTAIETMPAGVTLAFVPYGAGVPGLVADAKTKGHEILLQIPMQNASGSLPGPHALRTGEPADALAGDIAWLTSRFDGYDGVTNLLGAPVTADRTAMTALLKAVAGRGLFYLDDGTSTRSVVAVLAPDVGVGTVTADIVLDATSDPAIVTANLDRLVAIAKQKGSAIGMASGLPDHLPAIAHFASDLGAKGVVLVPVAAIAVQPRGDARDGTADLAKATAVTR